MPKIPVILDTDIGDDIDDALALALILNSPELDLLGVTTVFRNAPRRAQLAQKILRVWGCEDIPVAAGVSKPLLKPLNKLGSSLGPQFEELMDEDDDASKFPHALDWLLQTIDLDSEPDPNNRITIVPIGALTNIALFLIRAPQLAAHCRIVLMGGQWSAQQVEWNIRCDPDAAAIVFNSGAEISMIGLDVTRQCKLSEEQMDRIEAASTPRVALLGRLLHLWRAKHNRQATLHDPLAVLTVFDDCCQFEDKCIEVALCGEDRGKTLIVDGEPNTRVAMDVDAPRVVDLFMERIFAGE